MASDKSEEKSHEPTFDVDSFGWVYARIGKGHIRSQSVEAQLLYAILRHLEAGSRP